MAQFEFVAKDVFGKNFRGTLFAPSEQTVFFRLQKQGYVVLSVTEKEARFQGSVHQPVGIDEIVIFSKLFAAVISAGLTPVDAIAALEDQTEHPILRRVLKKVRIEVEQGHSMSTAFSHYPKAFPPLFVNMVQTGEVGGNLAKVMDRLTIYLEKDQEMRRSVRSAFTYPKIVFIFATIGIGYIMGFVVPAFQRIYKQLRNDMLPAPTKMLIFISDQIQTRWWFIIAAAISLVGLYLYFRFSKWGKPKYDRLTLALPVLGRINLRVCVSRMTRTLGSMLSCGVPLLTALDTVRVVIGNTEIENEIDKIIQSVQIGGTISGPVRISGKFPPLVSNMIAAGEQSGRLPELLDKCADALDRELEHYVKRFLFMLEPLLTVMIAVVVGFIAIAVYLPIFNLVGGMAGR